MVHSWNVALLQEATRHGVLPRLNIDRLLLFCVIMSAVYWLIYNAGMMPENRQERLKPESAETPAYSPVKPGISSDQFGYSALENSRPSLKPPGVCTNKARMLHMRRVCKRNGIEKYEYRLDGNQSIKMAVVDDRRKIFYCLIGKVGSKSWLDYLVRSTGKVDEDHRGQYRNTSFLRQIGLRVVTRFPMSVIDRRYQDYFKFVVVRHPLQRVVSAYYEVIAKLKKYKNHKGKPLDFRQYVKAITGKMLDYNPHWRRYHNRCKLCLVKYDYIIKMETTAEDIEDFNAAIGVQDVDLKHMHGNELADEGDSLTKSSYDPYKYDTMLGQFRKKDPALMRDLLKVYEDDMELFGYHWDWHSGKSKCAMHSNSSECC